jgi:hypothetical protein
MLSSQSGRVTVDEPARPGPDGAPARPRRRRVRRVAETGRRVEVDARDLDVGMSSSRVDRDPLPAATGAAGGAAVRSASPALELDGVTHGYTANEWLPAVYEIATGLLASARLDREPPSLIEVATAAVGGSRGRSSTLTRTRPTQQRRSSTDLGAFSPSNCSPRLHATRPSPPHSVLVSANGRCGQYCAGDQLSRQRANSAIADWSSQRTRWWLLLVVRKESHHRGPDGLLLR